MVDAAGGGRFEVIAADGAMDRAPTSGDGCLRHGGLFRRSRRSCRWATPPVPRTGVGESPTSVRVGPPAALVADRVAPAGARFPRWSRFLPAGCSRWLPRRRFGIASRPEGAENHGREHGMASRVRAVSNVPKSVREVNPGRAVAGQAKGPDAPSDLRRGRRFPDTSCRVARRVMRDLPGFPRKHRRTGPILAGGNERRNVFFDGDLGPLSPGWGRATIRCLQPRCREDAGFCRFPVGAYNQSSPRRAKVEPGPDADKRGLSSGWSQ